MHVFQLKYTVA